MLEMVIGVVIDFAFYVPGIETRKTVAAYSPRHFIQDTLLLRDLVHVQLEEPSFAAIHQAHANSLESIRQSSQRAHVEFVVHLQPRISQAGWQIYLSPESHRAARKHCLRLSRVSMQSIGQLQDALQVLFYCAVLTIALRPVKSILHHVLDLDRFVPVRFVLWRI